MTYDCCDHCCHDPRRESHMNACWVCEIERPEDRKRDDDE